MKKKKNAFLVVVVGLAALLFTLHVFAQTAPSTAQNVPGQNTLDDVLGFNLGVVPDSTGNIGLVSGFDFNYGKLIGLDWLTLGASYQKVNRTVTKESEEGLKREVTVVEEEIARFQPLALKIDLWNVMTIKPGGNVQLLYQNRSYEQTNRAENTFKNEEAKLRSLQFNAQLELWFYLGPVTSYITGSMNPYTRSDETGLGFDSYEISETDSEGNLSYLGETGDYSYSTTLETSYYDFKGYLDIRDLLFGVDLYLEGKYSYVSYDFKTKRSTVYNGELGSDYETKKYEKTDITATVGVELGFLDLGNARPLATFSYTNSQITDDVEHIFGAGLLLLQ